MDNKKAVLMILLLIIACFLVIYFLDTATSIVDMFRY